MTAEAVVVVSADGQEQKPAPMVVSEGAEHSPSAESVAAADVIKGRANEAFKGADQRAGSSWRGPDRPPPLARRLQNRRRCRCAHVP